MTTIIVAAVEGIAFLTVVSVLARLLVSQQRAHTRREDLLVNQLLHATSHTWEPPPVDREPVRELTDDLQRPRRFMVAPEQHTV